MKQSALVILLTMGLLAGGFFGCSGCKTGKGQLTPLTGLYDTNAVADTLVVTVENTREIALGVFDNFMRLEKENSAALESINPKIHEAAELVRRDGKKYLDALTNAKTAFQNSRSAAEATKLKEALASLQSLLRDSLKYTAQITAKKGTP